MSGLEKILIEENDDVWEFCNIGSWVAVNGMDRVEVVLMSSRRRRSRCSSRAKPTVRRVSMYAVAMNTWFQEKKTSPLPILEKTLLRIRRHLYLSAILYTARKWENNVYPSFIRRFGEIFTRHVNMTWTSNYRIILPYAHDSRVFVYLRIGTQRILDTSQVSKNSSLLESQW